MGTTLTGTTPQDTYDSLIKVTDNGPLSGTAKYLSDGLGNDSALALSTSAVGIGTNTPSEVLQVSKTQTATTRLQITNAQTGGSTSVRASLRVTANDRIGEFVAVNGDNVYVGAASNHNVALMSNGAGVLVGTPAGNVGIGTSAPQQKLHVSGIAANSYALLGTSTNWGSADTNRIKIGSTGDTFTLGCDLRANTNYAGTTETSLGLWVTNGSSTMVEVVRATPNGLTFNGDTAAANALDDYEEGTFTATLVPSTSGTITLNATYSTWSYTKIGNQVTVNGLAVVSSVSSPEGTYIKIGLPFTVGNSDSKYGGNSCLYSDASLSYAKSLLGGYNPRNTSQSYVYIDASTIATNDEFYFTTTYFV